MSHVPQIWCNADHYFQSYGILFLNCVRHFSLTDRHLENVSQTEPVFELNLAPSKKKADLRISVRFTHFIELLCERHKLHPLCHGKGQRSQRAKNKTEPVTGKISRRILN